MADPKLIDFIKQQLSEGRDKESIKNDLIIHGGWSSQDVDGVFSTIGTSNDIPIAPIAQISQIAPTPNLSQPMQVKYAGFWIRFVALMVDGIILAVIQFLIGLILILVIKLHFVVINSIINFLVAWTYFSWMTYIKGATLGKMLVGIRVESDNFQKLTFGRVLIRETIGKLISSIILFIGYIMAGFTERKQTLHDKIAHSVVVYNNSAKPRSTGMIVGIILAALLPGIAIVGILASVVLASLNVAREKGQDAKTEFALKNIQVGLVKDYGVNNSYSVTKSCYSGIFVTDEDIQKAIASIPAKGLLCYAEGNSYAVSADLQATSSSFCVDSSGYSNTGTAYDDGATAQCSASLLTDAAAKQLINNQIAPQTSTFVNKEQYSYNLPPGWQAVPTNTSYVEAINHDQHYVFALQALPLSSKISSASSITDVITPQDIKSLLLSQNSTTVIDSIDKTTVTGEKAYVSNFHLTTTSSTGSKTEQAVVQYDLFHKGFSYTLIFLSPSDIGSNDSIVQSIVNSFKFKS